MAIFENSQKGSKSAKTTSAGQKTLTSKQLREIQVLAYQFFAERGCEHGHDQEDWLKAEQMVRSK